MKMIANHGSRKKYYNEVVGVNSRLDTLQAAILKVKLKYLDAYTLARQQAADRYDELLGGHTHLTLPHRAPYGTHVFHQYTIRVSQEVPGGRDGLAKHLQAKGVPHAIYYPVALHQLPVFEGQTGVAHGDLTETEKAAAEVISLPMHTELTSEQQEHIAGATLEYTGPTAQHHA
jgi:dTDP-4-amino-4,6-dideoxygalactose transaminase